MKKIILLLTLSVILTSCYLLEMSDYRGCSYDDEKQAFYKSVYIDGKYVGIEKCNVKPR